MEQAVAVLEKSEVVPVGSVAITVRRYKGIAIVRCEGQMDICAKDQFSEVVEESLSSGCDKFIIDLNEAEHFDSECLKVLIRINNAFDTNSHLILVVPQRRCNQLPVFKIEKFKKMFTFGPSIAEAIGLF